MFQRGARSLFIAFAMAFNNGTNKLKYCLIEVTRSSFHHHSPYCEDSVASGQNNKLPRVYCKYGARPAIITNIYGVIFRAMTDPI